MNGIDLIKKKREETKKRFTKKHDRNHTDESLALAACYYALPKCYETPLIRLYPKSWSTAWANKHNGDRIRDLVIAGALIASEIDRLLEKHSSEATR